ncbi:MAG: hypothetical protein ACP5K5_00785 [Candidatus Micrarchaeia archaeon]
MDYYDIVLSSGLEKLGGMLGYKKILIAGKDFPVAEIGSNENQSGRVAIGRDTKVLLKACRTFASAVILNTYAIDKSLIEGLKEYRIPLIIPFNQIIGNKGFRLSKSLYLARRLFLYAKKKKIEVGFATLADSELGMESYIQLIELAKLIGASDEDARKGLNVAGRLVNV